LRVLLLAATTGYQTRAFGDAAERLGVELVFATDRCNVLDDPWRDAAMAIRFEHEDAAVFTLLDAARAKPLDGVLAVGDRPTVIAARVLQGLGLDGHLPGGAAMARHKVRARTIMRDAGLPAPWFVPARVSADPHLLATQVSYPCVLKPAALSASRGVMRADDPAGLVAAFYRLRALLQAPDLRAERNEAHADALVEEFIAGREFAVEGIMNHGVLHPLAIFDKPDPLDGPFFEETIYVTPSTAPEDTQHEIVDTVGRAARALGLRHGPVHAECRVNASGVFMLEAAARPIGGLCARALRFVKRDTAPGESPVISLEELLLRHALGERSTCWEREPQAAGVMMIPIPRRGLFKGVSGADEARAVPHVEDVRITAKADQVLVPLPEGASYLGFIFARGGEATDVAAALRLAHSRLGWDIAPEVRVLQSVHG
jgi:hypothetical protein